MLQVSTVRGDTWVFVVPLWPVNHLIHNVRNDLIESLTEKPTCAAKQEYVPAVLSNFSKVEHIEQTIVEYGASFSFHVEFTDNSIFSRICFATMLKIIITS